MIRPLQVAALVVGLLFAAGAAVAFGAVSFSEPPRAAVAAQTAPEPTPTIDLVAANAQMMTDCNCGK